MSDPTRLLLSSGGGEADDFEKKLLGSWEAEQPSDDARSRVLAMVGLGVAAGGAAGAGTIAKVGATAGGSIAPKAGAIGAAALAKWLVIGAVGAATAGATFVYARHAQHASPAPAVTSQAVAGPMAAPPAATVTVRTGDVATAPATQEPARATGTSPQRRTPGAERSTRPSDPALGEQVSAVDRARRALADGDAAGALRQLDDYESRFPRGALVEEAEVLRVESLLAQGDKSGAARVGGRFLAAHPDSPHAARVRTLPGQGSGP